MRRSAPRRSTSAQPERVVVINLARRPERLVRMAAQLRACGWNERAEFFRAYDGLEIDQALLDRMGITLFDRWQQPRSSQMFHARPIKLGEIGCALSHLSVWQMIAARGWQTTLILEDDVALPPTVADDTDRLMRKAESSAPG